MSGTVLTTVGSGCWVTSIHRATLCFSKCFSIFAIDNLKDPNIKLKDMHAEWELYSGYPSPPLDTSSLKYVYVDFTGGNVMKALV